MLNCDGHDARMENAAWEMTMNENVDGNTLEKMMMMWCNETKWNEKDVKNDGMMMEMECVCEN